MGVRVSQVIIIIIIIIIISFNESCQNATRHRELDKYTAVLH